jgi:ABC-2 type transport system ATP-binding protein
MPLLELRNLKKYYATQKAVDDISFSVESKSIFGLLGPMAPARQLYSE